VRGSSSPPSLGGERFQLFGLVQNHARQRIELTAPRLARKHCPGVGVADIPAMPDSGGTEIDVLGMAFMG
jgi:hypothetical protein